MKAENKLLNNSINSIEQVLDVVDGDMQQVNANIRGSLDSHVVLIKQISEYIINSGGKRLRPILVVLMARALGYSGKDHIQLAAIVEFIHTATLLHDDVVDESDMRRGNKTANEVWGNSASVLVGDFLYSRSFQMMVSLQNIGIMDILANATNTISEGEVLQLLNIGNLEITEEQYYQVIFNKTAKLFEAGCELSALISNCDEESRGKIANYGKYLGMAFQIADDILDYSVDSEQLGKNVGDDLAEGKLTLPLIYLLENGTTEDKQLIEAAIKSSSIKYLKKLQTRLDETQSLNYCKEKASEFADKAKQQLDNLDNGQAKEALLFLCDFACNRTQ